MEKLQAQQSSSHGQLKNTHQSMIINLQTVIVQDWQQDSWETRFRMCILGHFQLFNSDRMYINLYGIKSA